MVTQILDLDGGLDLLAPGGGRVRYNAGSDSAVFMVAAKPGVTPWD